MMISNRDDILSFNRKLQLPYQYYYPDFNYFDDKQNSVKVDLFYKSLGEDTNRDAILYIHVPFCTSNCLFCDFDKSYKLLDMDEYTKKVLDEIESFSRFSYTQSLRITHVHLGGGTPTLLSIKQIELILKCVMERYNVSNACYSIEVSPDSVSSDMMIDYLCAGRFDRISLGVQTFDELLRKNLHIHSSIHDLNTAIGKLNKGNFELSVDLMYGFPYIYDASDEILRLMSDIKRALSYGIDSVELNLLYPLTLLSKISTAIRIPTSSQVIEARRCAASYLVSHGYRQHSDFSFRTQEGNINFEKAYFGNGYDTPDCIAFGASSFGYLNGVRYKNMGIALYMSTNNRFSLLHFLTQQEIFRRKIIGFSKHLFLHKSPVIDFMYDHNFFLKIQHLKDYRMIYEEDSYYALTELGKDYTDNIIFTMLSDEEQEHICKNVKCYLYL